MSRLEILEDQVLPKAVVDGAFGDNVELIKCDAHDDSHGEDQFASVILYSSIKIRRNSQTEELRLVVKFNQESEIFRKSVSTDIQFQNEVFMYNNIFPFLQVSEDIIPKCYYGIATGGVTPDMDVILLQDVCKENYQINKGIFYLNYNHAVTALQQLARFHAVSYISKHKDEVTFVEKVDYLKEAQWVSKKSDYINACLTPVLQKVMNVLLVNKENTSSIDRFMANVNDPFSYVRKLLDPIEPISVICHGDFCANNILFKYDDNGVPFHAKFVDFGTARYGSPIIDLSFFLFFNTTSKLRRAHLDDLMTEYYNVLKSSSLDNIIPSIEVFEKEFHMRAVYGFLDCCVQIPIALSEPIDWEDLSALSVDQLHSYYSSRCNQQATDLLCEIFRDLIYFNCKL